MAQTDRQTDRHTHGHGDSMTNLAQWGRVGENIMLSKIQNIHADRIEKLLNVYVSDV